MNLDELAEAGGVVVAGRLRVTEGFQDRVRLNTINHSIQNNVFIILGDEGKKH